MNWLDEAKNDVRQFAKEHLDEILEQLLIAAEVEEWVGNYREELTHETADSSFACRGAEDHIAVLRDLSDYKESGWMSGGWKEQLQAAAFWTYRNALESLFQKLAKDINKEANNLDSDLGTLLADEEEDEEEEAEATFDDIFAVVNDVSRPLGVMIKRLSKDSENKLLLSQCGDALEEEGRIELATAVRQRLRWLERSAAVKTALEQFIAGWNSMK